MIARPPDDLTVAAIALALQREAEGHRAAGAKGPAGTPTPGRAAASTDLGGSAASPWALAGRLQQLRRIRR